jgi:hypothetical protein
MWLGVTSLALDLLRELWSKPSVTRRPRINTDLSTLSADIVVTICPSDCCNCSGVYVSEFLGSRIICKCTQCHHKKRNYRSKISSAQKTVSGSGSGQGSQQQHYDASDNDASHRLHHHPKYAKSVKVGQGETINCGPNSKKTAQKIDPSATDNRPEVNVYKYSSIEKGVLHEAAG